MAPDLNRLIQIRTTPVEPAFGVEHSEFGFVPAGTDTDDQATTGQVIEHRQLLARTIPFAAARRSRKSRGSPSPSRLTDTPAPSVARKSTHRALPARAASSCDRRPRRCVPKSLRCLRNSDESFDCRSCWICRKRNTELHRDPQSCSTDWPYETGPQDPRLKVVIRHRGNGSPTTQKKRISMYSLMFAIWAILNATGEAGAGCGAKAPIPDRRYSPRAMHNVSHDPVKLRSRRYSPDERRLAVVSGHSGRGVGAWLHLWMSHAAVARPAGVRILVRITPTNPDAALPEGNPAFGFFMPCVGGAWRAVSCQPSAISGRNGRGPDMASVVGTWV